MMNCCLSLPHIANNKAQERISHEIDRQLKEDRKSLYRYDMHILLLGGSESGKSTFFKQMKIIHSQNAGFSEDEIKAYVPTIHQNILERILMLTQCFWLWPPLPLKLIALSSIIKEIKSVTELSATHIKAIKSLWSDCKIQIKFRNSYKVSETDTFNYFVSNLDRILSKDYLPTQEDILRAQVPETCPLEHIFECKSKNIRIKITELSYKLFRINFIRRSWSHHFYNIDEIFFFVDVSDVTNLEFRYVLSMIPSWFRRRSSIHLFLNKRDILEKEIKANNFPLKKHCPEFTGDEMDVDDVCTFIEKSFQDVQRIEFGQRAPTINSYFISAINTENIKYTFENLVQLRIRCYNFNY